MSSQHNKLDGLFQEIGLKRAHYTSVVSGARATVIHHFYGRRNHATRWYLPNAIALTNDEHERIHNQDKKYLNDLIREKLGDEWFNNLQKTSHQTAKYYSFQDVLDHLQGKSKHYIKNWDL